MEAIQKAAPGWYPCPADPDALRFFNGSAWTEETRQRAVPPTQPVFQAAVQPVFQEAAAPGHSQQAGVPAAQPGWQVPVSQVHGHTPVRTTSVPTYGAQGYQPYDPLQGDTSGPRSAMHWIVPVGRSGASIAAGYVGLVALAVWPAGPLAIGLGFWGLRKARTGGHGSGRSVFAVIAGTLSTVLAVLFLTGSLL